MRYLQIAHALPGRTRLRAAWIRKDPAKATAIAETYAAMTGVHEVQIRPYTGSILVIHDDAVTLTAVVEVARRVLDAERVLDIGERPPPNAEVPRLSRIAQLAAVAFHELDREILRRTGGSFDLGTLATFGFFGAGAVEVAVERQISTPPWFNLAWWGYRTFVVSEREEIEAANSTDPGTA